MRPFSLALACHLLGPPLRPVIFVLPESLVPDCDTRMRSRASRAWGREPLASGHPSIGWHLDMDGIWMASGHPSIASFTLVMSFSPEHTSCSVALDRSVLEV